MPGQDPCPLLEKHGGIWKFDENKLGQTQEERRRKASRPACARCPPSPGMTTRFISSMNNRDQLDILWRGHSPAQENAERPAEPMYRAVRDRTSVGRTASSTTARRSSFSILNTAVTARRRPLQSVHAAGRQLPGALGTGRCHVLQGSQFPESYRNGAFIAFHGSWNRAPMPQDGYNVTFQPFANGKPSGAFEIFAEGFAGATPLMQPNAAVARANGVAQGPDGSLYIAESQKGKDLAGDLSEVTGTTTYHDRAVHDRQNLAGD